MTTVTVMDPTQQFQGNPVDLYISELALLKQVPKRLNSLAFPCLLKCKNNSTETCAFIDSNSVRNLSLPLLKLPLPGVLRVVDGRESESGMVTHSAICQIQIGNLSEAVRLFVTKFRPLSNNPRTRLA